MDTTCIPGEMYNVKIYEEIKGQVVKLMMTYRLKPFAFVPVSGLNGDNIKEPTKLIDGVSTLFDALLAAGSRVNEKPVQKLRQLKTLKALLRVTGKVLITKGYECVLHIGENVIDCEVLSVGDAFPPKASILRQNSKGNVVIDLATTIDVEDGLVNFVMRNKSDTVAIGEILE
jgi:translation elongation factor EF-1alpha